MPTTKSDKSTDNREQGVEKVKPEVLPAGAKPPRTEVARYLHTVASKANESSEDASDAIIERILSGTSVQDILRTSVVVHAKDVLYVPLVIDSVRWERSDFEGAEGVYAICEGRQNASGEPIVVSCGGRQVMAQLFKLDELAAFPCLVQFNQSSRPTANGYYPLWLEPVAGGDGKPEEAF